MTSVVVFDYGFGNVRSMVRALANLDLDVTLTSDHRQALEADGLVVPGVGAFGACMEGLKSVGGDRVIKDRLRAGRPVLGVCVVTTGLRSAAFPSSVPPQAVRTVRARTAAEAPRTRMSMVHTLGDRW